MLHSHAHASLSSSHAESHVCAQLRIWNGDDRVKRVVDFVSDASAGSKDPGLILMISQWRSRRRAQQNKARQAKSVHANTDYVKRMTGFGTTCMVIGADNMNKTIQPRYSIMCSANAASSLREGMLRAVDSSCRQS